MDSTSIDTRFEPPGISAARYRLPAKIFHWLTAAFILSNIPLGAVLDQLPRVPSTYVWYSVHKSIGALVFFTTLLRLAYRWSQPAPPLASTMPSWQRRTAQVTHGMLYFMLLALPLVGWLLSQASGHPLVFMGLVPMPAPVPVDALLSDRLHQVHALLAWTLTALLCLHVLAVLKHSVIDRDDTLRRMLSR
ncbi:cytochrome b [Telluria mixta]|uniref:Cytochrome b n=1 Tax=Telluria mixta TaxID=34071 RepID=A0ABT2BS05_9BURK|nr:cytochrome b [Telluria mixta]MCS0627896.1 cytochrome b [Telluria mixta]WEM93985.1 cytochrome b [Telluria mixta]